MKMGHAAEEAAHHALVSQITNEDDINKCLQKENI